MTKYYTIPTLVLLTWHKGLLRLCFKANNESDDMTPCQWWPFLWWVVKRLSRTASKPNPLTLKCRVMPKEGWGGGWVGPKRNAQGVGHPWTERNGTLFWEHLAPWAIPCLKQRKNLFFKNLFPSYTLRVFNEKQRDKLFQKMKWAVQLFSKMSGYLQRTDLAYNVPWKTLFHHFFYIFLWMIATWLPKKIPLKQHTVPQETC